jgi:hypothetical protein
VALPLCWVGSPPHRHPDSGAGVARDCHPNNSNSLLLAFGNKKRLRTTAGVQMPKTSSQLQLKARAATQPLEDDASGDEEDGHSTTLPAHDRDDCQREKDSEDNAAEATDQEDVNMGDDGAGLMGLVWATKTSASPWIWTRLSAAASPALVLSHVQIAIIRSLPSMRVMRLCKRISHDGCVI